MAILVKKKWHVFFILLFTIILSVFVLAEKAAFFWYGADDIQCSRTDAGTVPGCCGEDGTHKITTSYFSDSAPVNDHSCCDVQGPIKVEFYTTYGHTTSKVTVYNINWDERQVDCECYFKKWSPSIFFEANKPSCCGDDTFEHYITKGLGIACCSQRGDNVCVSASGKCRYEYVDGITGETTCYDGQDNDCDAKIDCSDLDCQTGTETDCRDKINNDCDAYTDCSDTDCALSTDCIGCEPENTDEACSDGIDNDCDGYTDCIDTDCINTNVCPCEPVAEICDDNKDNDCDGKKDCEDEDCFESCGGGCVAENTVGLCSNGLDDDCDGFVDNLDNDCPGCGMNEKLCSDGSCKESCDPVGPQGCVGVANGVCEKGEGCACADCLGKRDSCERELVCDVNDKVCKCPSGTVMCSDGRCRKKCFVCGNGMLEEGEECDGGTTTCPTGCTGGEVTCKADCTWDTSSCSSCQQCDPAKIDNYCCVIEGDGKCDLECTATADPDCAEATSYSEDGCNDAKDGRCDFDCINYKDPDCSVSCTSGKDNCCDARSGNGCDPDCNQGVDPDCGVCTSDEGDCCDDSKDGVCDPDCISGVDPDCLCGNGVIDSGETCDSVNLDGKSCDTFFAGYGGLLACFGVDGEHPCHFDTSGCHKIPEVCTGGSCSFGKDCRCPECVGKQGSCGYGAVCDVAARCACVDGMTLCVDGTCRTVQNCNDYGGGEQGCVGVADGVCDPGEGCGCSDCDGKKGPCNALSVCQGGVCSGCFLKKAYWLDVRSGDVEDCIGSGNDIKMVVEGLPGCEGKIVSFAVDGVVLVTDKAVFKNGRAELVWNTTPHGNYKFEAMLEGGDDKISSKKLEVQSCVKTCDVDCDNICETQECVIENPGYCKNKKDPMEEGKYVLDVNTMTGHCEGCDDYGLSKGQETCAAYYDCTPGWWGDDNNYNGAGTAAEARGALEWGECGVPKVEPPSQLGVGRQEISGNMRNRLICPSGLSRQQCCADQANCYCKLPKTKDMDKKGINCNLPEFRPTEIKSCLAEEKFPFFTNTNILIVVLILTGFYIWKTKSQEKTKKNKKTSKKR